MPSPWEVDDGMWSVVVVVVDGGGGIGACGVGDCDCDDNVGGGDDDDVGGGGDEDDDDDGPVVDAVAPVVVDFDAGVVGVKSTCFVRIYRMVLTRSMSASLFARARSTRS